MDIPAERPVGTPQKAPEPEKARVRANPTQKAQTPDTKPDNAIDRAFKTIAEQRIPIIRGPKGMFVPGASHPDIDSIPADAFLSRQSQSRLEQMERFQRLEIARLASYLRTQPKTLSLDIRDDDDTRFNIDQAPKAIRTLARHWYDHPDVRKAELEAMQEIRQIARELRQQEEHSKRTILPESRSQLPSPNQAKDPHAREFLAALRSGAGDQQLQEITSRIASNEAAHRELIQMGPIVHGTYLRIEQNREIQTAQSRDRGRERQRKPDGDSGK